MQEVGYQHGRTVFDIWGRIGVLENMLQDRQGTSKMKACDVSARAHTLLPFLPQWAREAQNSLHSAGPWHTPLAAQGPEDRAGVWPRGGELLASASASPLFAPLWLSTRLVLTVEGDGGLLRPLPIFCAPAPTPGVNLGTLAN